MEERKDLVPVSSKRFDRALFIKGLVAGMTRSPFKVALTQVGTKVIAQGVVEVGKEASKKIFEDRITDRQMEDSFLEDRPWYKNEERDFTIKLIESGQQKISLGWPSSVDDKTTYMKILLNSPWRAKLLEFWHEGNWKRLPRAERFQIFKRLVTYYHEALEEYREVFPITDEDRQIEEVLRNYKKRMKRVT